MNKPWYLSKKLWTAVVTVLMTLSAFIVGTVLEKPELAEQLAMVISTVGTALIVGFGLADFGKEAE